MLGDLEEEQMETVTLIKTDTETTDSAEMPTTLILGSLIFAALVSKFVVPLSTGEPQLIPAMKRKRELISSTLSSSILGGAGCPPIVERFCMQRVRPINSVGVSTGKCVLYWMSRDQRIHDNHAIHYAQELSKQHNIPLHVVFNIVPKFLQATIRQFDFMLKGLQEIQSDLLALNIPFHLTTGNPTINVPRLARESEALAVIADFSPLRTPMMWVNSVATVLSESSSQFRSIPLYQVDAHNIIPCWIASDKAEYAARTFRPKVHSKIGEFLDEIPEIEANQMSPKDVSVPVIDWDSVYNSLEVDFTVKPVDHIIPGHRAAWNEFRNFVDTRLSSYESKRNDPNENAQSNLSPYFHFGQIGVQSVVIKLKQLKKHHGSVDAFVEEAVVRRELSDNYCFFNPNTYDSLLGCYDWATETLRTHSSDTRKPVYTEAQLDAGGTYDDLWNAAQMQLVQEGKMHGFLRMYWAKKILEWTESPEEAYRICLHLNDRYSIDGRDPNGYVGVLWSIGGLHGMGWKERPIFGKIRYMNYAGCVRKFDVKKFVARYPVAASNIKKASK